MTPKKNMMMGAMLAASGIAITGIAVALTPYLSSLTISWVGRLAGVMVFLAGMMQWLISYLKGSKGKITSNSKLDVLVLIRSMVAISASDGILSEEEVSLIQSVSSSIVGMPIKRERIENSFRRMRSDNFANFELELNHLAEKVTPTGAEQAVKGAVMVAIVDDELHEEEKQRILYISDMLGVSRMRFVAICDEASTELRRMRAAGESDAERNAKEPLNKPISA